MAYNSAYAWTQNPNMRGASALNPRTMLIGIPYAGRDPSLRAEEVLSDITTYTLDLYMNTVGKPLSHLEFTVVPDTLQLTNPTFTPPHSGVFTSERIVPRIFRGQVALFDFDSMRLWFEKNIPDINSYSDLVGLTLLDDKSNTITLSSLVSEFQRVGNQDAVMYQMTSPTPPVLTRDSSYDISTPNLLHTQPYDMVIADLSRTSKLNGHDVYVGSMSYDFITLSRVLIDTIDPSTLRFTGKLANINNTTLQKSNPITFTRNPFVIITNPSSTNANLNITIVKEPKYLTRLEFEFWYKSDAFTVSSTIQSGGDSVEITMDYESTTTPPSGFNKGFHVVYDNLAGDDTLFDQAFFTFQTIYTSTHFLDRAAYTCILKNIRYVDTRKPIDYNRSITEMVSFNANTNFAPTFSTYTTTDDIDLTTTVHLKKDYFPLRSYTVNVLMPDAAKITVQGVDPVTWTSFDKDTYYNVTNTGILPTSGVNLVAITFDKADGAYANEADVVLFRFAMNTTDNRNLRFNTNDFAVGIVAYEALHTNNQYFQQVVSAVLTPFTWTPTYYLSFTSDYKVDTEQIRLPVTLHKAEGEFTRSFLLVLWYNSSKFTESPGLLTQMTNYQYTNSGPLGNIPTPSGFDSGRVFAFSNSAPNPALPSDIQDLAGSTQAICTFTLTTSSLRTITNSDYQVQLVSYEAYEPTQTFYIEDYTIPTITHYLEGVSTQIDSSTVELAMAINRVDTTRGLYQVRLVLWYNDPDTELTFDYYDQTGFVLDPANNPILTLNYADGIPPGFDTGVLLSYTLNGSTDPSVYLGKLVFTINDTMLSLSSFPFELRMLSYVYQDDQSTTISTNESSDVAWTPTIVDQLLAHFNPTFDNSLTYDATSKSVSQATDLLLGTPYSIVGTPKMYDAIGHDGDLRNGHRFVDFRNGGLYINAGSINTLFGDSGPIRGILYVFFTTSGESLTQDNNNMTLAGYDYSNHSSGTFGVGRYKATGNMVTVAGQVDFQRDQQISIRWSEAAHTNYHVAVSQLNETATGIWNVNSELHTYQFTDNGTNRPIYVEGSFSQVGAPDKKSYQSSSTTMNTRDGSEFLIGFRNFAETPDGYSKQKIGYVKYIRTYGSGHNATHRQSMVDSIMTHFNTSYAPRTTGLLFSHPDGRTWKFDKAANRIRLNSGTEMVLDINDDSRVHNSAVGYVGFIDSDTKLSVRHANYSLKQSTFTNDNLDYAWKVIRQTPTGFTYRLHNDYLSESGGFYIGYDDGADEVLLVPATDSRRILSWTCNKFIHPSFVYDSP